MRLALLACVLLTGCASIGIPPWGPEPGSYGTLEIKYTPNWEKLIDAAWRRQFTSPASTGLAK